MALSGMTGFARVEGAHGARAWAWELKSVNGRNLDVRVRTPSGLDGLEAAARAAAKVRFSRGSIQAGLQLRREGGEAQVRVNTEQLEAILNTLSPYARRPDVAPPNLDGLLALRGVMETEDDTEDDDRAALVEAITASLNEGLDALAVARGEEGDSLHGILREVLDSIAALRADASERAAGQPAAIHERLQTRLAELVREAVPADRLAAEAAALAVKADVREELDRLAAHIDTARDLIAGDGPVGRKLEFLAQEFMREANTLCAKSADLELTRIGLDLKSAVDQFREQVANVE